MTAHQQIRSGLANVNGTRLYYEVAGAGHPLVLIHGGQVDRRLWDDQFAAFARSYTVVRYDLRGFGESERVAAEGEPYSLRQDLVGLLRFLEIERTYLLGLSMGGELALDFTLEHPEMVDALVLVSAAVSGVDPTRIASQEETREFMAVQQALAQADLSQKVEILVRLFTVGPRRVPEQIDPAVLQRARAMTSDNIEHILSLNMGAAGALRIQPLEPPALGRLAEVQAPTLIVAGDKDAPLILSIADILENGIAGARKVVVPNTAHHLPMEQPEAFNRMVLDFLRALPPVPR
jgi:3-oxoadipate enol-lactonase